MEWYPLDKGDTGFKIVRRDLVVPKIIEYFKGKSQPDERIDKAIEWTEEDIIEAWNSAYCGDSFHDGKDYLGYMKKNYNYLKTIPHIP